MPNLADWQNILASVRKTSKAAAEHGLPVYWLGDWNARALVFGDSKENTHGKQLAECIDDCKLTALNPLLAPGIPTFPRSKSVIDLAFTNQPKTVAKFSVSDELLSDHRCLIVSLASNAKPTAQQQSPSRFVFDWKQADFKRFKQLAEERSPTLLDELKRIAEEAS